jgi:hypothetical protein
MYPAEPWLQSAHWQCCFILTLIPAQHGDVECRIALVALRGDHDVAQRDGSFLAVAPPFVGETSLWLERSPSMSWL